MRYAARRALPALWGLLTLTGCAASLTPPVVLRPLPPSAELMAACPAPRVVDDWRLMALDAVEAWADCAGRQRGLAAWAGEVSGPQ